MSNMNVGDDLRKIMMAGIGAVATLTEKSKEWIEEMAQKGETSAQNAQPVIDELVKKGEEVKGKIREAFEGVRKEAEQWDLDDMAQSFGNMTDDALNTLKSKLDELIEYRKNQPQQEQACDCGCEGKAEEPCCEGEQEQPCDCGCAGEREQHNEENQG